LTHAEQMGPLSAQRCHYAEEFAKLDLEALKQDMFKLMTTSQDWWPADYGHYGPFFIRMAWHSAGSYRSGDGRGGANAGNLRFAPLNSWPDNVNLDKAKRLLWPIKKKYGAKISWADLIIFAGNCAMESMGCPPFGFAGGRIDIWSPEKDVYWGPEKEWLTDERHIGEDEDIALMQELAADQMGLIYVNPEGPGGVPDIKKSGIHIRLTFRNMGMDDEETVALIAGGHTFGKAHGAADPEEHVGNDPEGAKIEEMGFGWASTHGTGKGKDTISSGLEGAWTINPTKWDNGFFHNLYAWTWEKKRSPAGAIQWEPTTPSAKDLVPDAHVEGQGHAPIMFTTDLALRYDDKYGPISKRFLQKPEEFQKAFAKAWYKLTHRDMGPITRCLGPMVPEEQLWQDPVPKVTHALIDESDIDELKKKILESGCEAPQLVGAAWGSASTFRGSDYRGGASGGRIALEPQKDWAVNNPTELPAVLGRLKCTQARFNQDPKNVKAKKEVSLADLIVLGGCAAIEEAAKKGGLDIKVPFSPGRGDALQEQTDVKSFNWLKPKADGFRNYNTIETQPPEELLVDRAALLTLTAPEMAVLVAGMRVLDANTGGSKLGVLTDKPGTLSNDFFVNLLDMEITWKASAESDTVYEGRSLTTGEVKYKASRVDLIFGSNSELRALAEHYACDDMKEDFVGDFVSAWTKVMNLDRFDLHGKATKVTQDLEKLSVRHSLHAKPDEELKKTLKAVEEVHTRGIGCIFSRRGIRGA